MVFEKRGQIKMAKSILRRQFLKTGIGFIVGVESTKLFSKFSTVAYAQIAFPQKYFCRQIATGNPNITINGQTFPSLTPPPTVEVCDIPNPYYFNHIQEDWRYCVKCQLMFYQGPQGSPYDKRRGVCAAGGVHEPAGYQFVLLFDSNETREEQGNWRYCNKCQSLFYQGPQGTLYDQVRGVCAAGGVHEPAGYQFVLPHDLSGDLRHDQQKDWRYCTKCHSMFFIGVQGSDYDRRRGVCAAGGVHNPDVYNFFLLHH